MKGEALRKQIAENFALCKEHSRKAADAVEQSEQRLNEVDQRLDRHLERLEEGEIEYTPPPFELSTLEELRDEKTNPRGKPPKERP